LVPCHDASSCYSISWIARQYGFLVAANKDLSRWKEADSMPKKGARNCFISYHFGRDYGKKEELSELIARIPSIRDYSIALNKWQLAVQVLRQVIHRSWSCSVVILLVGKETCERPWIARELEEGRKHRRPRKSPARRVRKPKGVLAIQLPGAAHTLPPAVNLMIENQHAVSMNWEDVDADSLVAKVDEAYSCRPTWESLGYLAECPQPKQLSFWSRFLAVYKPYNPEE